MFVRKKKNRSDSTSVVVVDKRSGKIRYLKTIGVSSDETELAELYSRGKKWVSEHSLGKDMFEASAREQEEKQTIERFLSRVFRRVGFDRIDDDILKHLGDSTSVPTFKQSGNGGLSAILF